AECALPCDVWLDCWAVAMGFAFSFVGDVAFVFECSKHSQHRGAREFVRECIAHLGDSSRSALPEHGHDVQLSISEGNRHGPLTKDIVDTTTTRSTCQLVS